MVLNMDQEDGYEENNIEELEPEVSCQWMVMCNRGG